MDDLVFSADHGQLSLRWLHVLAMAVWVGLLFFFLLIQRPFAATLDLEGKRQVLPGLVGRALHWFRWAALITWFSGAGLLFILYYAPGSGLYFAAPIAFERGAPEAIQWLPPFLAMFAVLPLYEFLFRVAGPGKKLAGAVAQLLVLGLIVTYYRMLVGPGPGLSARAACVHAGALMGTILAWNVWARICPAQGRMLAALASGAAPNPSDAALVAQRAGHNLTMAVAVLYLMVSVDQGRFGTPPWITLAGVLCVSWLVGQALLRWADRVRPQ